MVLSVDAADPKWVTNKINWAVLSFNGMNFSSFVLFCFFCFNFNTL